MVNIRCYDGAEAHFRAVFCGDQIFTIEGTRYRCRGFAVRTDAVRSLYQARRSRVSEINQGTVQYGIEKSVSQVKLEGELTLEQLDYVYIQGYTALFIDNVIYFIEDDVSLTMDDGVEVHLKRDGAIIFIATKTVDKYNPSDYIVSVSYWLNSDEVKPCAGTSVSGASFSTAGYHRNRRTGGTVYLPYSAEDTLHNFCYEMLSEPNGKVYSSFEASVRNFKINYPYAPSWRSNLELVVQKLGSYTLAEALTALRRKVRSLWHEIPATTVDWQLLCNNACDGLKLVNPNMIAYLAELPQFAGEISALGEVINNPRSIKNWAGLYLSYKYGTRLTISDTRDFIHEVGVLPEANIEDVKLAKQIDDGMMTIAKTADEMAIKLKTIKGLSHPCSVRSRANYTSKEADSSYAAYKITYSPINPGIDGIINALDRLALWPTLSRLYDLIPFSFVFNWIVNVQQALEGYDNWMRVSRYPIISEVKSERVQWSVEVLGQNLTAVWYDRKASPRLTVHPAVIDVDTLTIGEHLTEVFALIAQSRK